VGHPAGDRLLVAFGGAPLGPLHRPAQPVAQDRPDMAGVVAHPGELGDHHRDPLERAGLPRIRFHDLRHSAATLLLGLGIHPKIVSELLGHSQVSITLDLYSHVTATMQQEAVRAFQGLIRKSTVSRQAAAPGAAQRSRVQAVGCALVRRRAGG
jgi:hypothetical protein